MFLVRVQVRFDAPVFARFVSNADRIGKDDGLTRIDAPVDWWWCSPTRKRGLGRSGIGSQGYDLRVCLKYLLIGRWHPEAGAGTPNGGWISCCFAAPTSLHLRPMRRPIAVFATHDDLLAGVYRFRIEQCLYHDDALPDSSGGPKQNARRAMAAIGQNLPRKHRQSQPDHQNRFARCKASRPDRMAKSTLPPKSCAHAEILITVTVE
ncbi:MAG: hypothetical protein GDA36_05850 [Rhodobacteraceae bacterium]|nr:hypothetical protein [Paracoccaceae bacterium]